MDTRPLATTNPFHPRAMAQGARPLLIIARADCDKTRAPADCIAQLLTSHQGVPEPLFVVIFPEKPSADPITRLSNRRLTFAEHPGRVKGHQRDADAYLEMVASCQAVRAPKSLPALG